MGNVDKAKAFLMLYKESRSVYDALSAEEKKKCEEKAEAAKVQFQAEHKEWKLKNKDNKENKGNTNGKGPKRPPGAYAQWIADNRPMLTEKVMKEHNVDKAKAFLMLYKESRSVYDSLPATERKQAEAKAEAAKVKFQAEHKEWKLGNKAAKVGDGAEEEDGEEEEGEGEDEEEDVQP